MHNPQNEHCFLKIALFVNIVPSTCNWFLGATNKWNWHIKILSAKKISSGQN